MPAEDNKTQTKTKKALIDLLINLPIFDALDSDELRIATRYMSHYQRAKRMPKLVNR